jgi:pimeloyl-ACP methyl ester carboxylesterase
MDGLTAWTVGLLDAMGIDACHVVGFSMGGFVGLRLAARHPERVRSLCLVGSGAGGEPMPFRLWHTCATLPALGARWFPPARWAVRRAMRVNFFAPGFADSDAGRWWLARLMDYRPADMVRATTGVLWRPPIADDELRRITQPVLFVRGARDEVRAGTDAEPIRACCARARFDEVAQSGHSVPVEAPGALNRALVDHLHHAEHSRS